MSKNKGFSDTSANRYSLALFELASEAKILSSIEENSTALLNLILNSKDFNLNVGHAGTAMRFLTSFFSVKKNSIVEIYGSKRMHKRPISILVKSLKEIGAQIEYLENGGFPPLRIIGHKLQSKKLKIDSSISSQFISSLILISPKRVTRRNSFRPRPKAAQFICGIWYTSKNRNFISYF